MCTRRSSFALGTRLGWNMEGRIWSKHKKCMVWFKLTNHIKWNSAHCCHQLNLGLVVVRLLIVAQSQSTDCTSQVSWVRFPVTAGLFTFLYLPLYTTAHSTVGCQLATWGKCFKYSIIVKVKNLHWTATAWSKEWLEVPFGQVSIT